ncbi:hypothetical protein CCH79_00014396 [Gambusia affinis]|uniref:Cadherin domain-containing protein n=1 Tax=Gambusia affinis TaxID=33528 RepID=A0A315V2J5_GAMAF|nr:hypothetical protein CCH79_00014396 [Gambusia affinis]
MAAMIKHVTGRLSVNPVVDQTELPSGKRVFKQHLGDGKSIKAGWCERRAGRAPEVGIFADGSPPRYSAPQLRSHRNPPPKRPLTFLTQPSSGFLLLVLHSALHTDLDVGNKNIKYVLAGEGAGTIFAINELTGDIHAMKRLDREEKAEYTLTAQVINADTDEPLEPPSEFIIKVQDINDNPPQFIEGPYRASVPEIVTSPLTLKEPGVL